MAQDSLGEVVGRPGFELHGFWAWRIRGKQTSVPHRSVARGRNIGRVWWYEGFFLDFLLGVVVLEFRHGVVNGGCDAVLPWWFVVGLVEFGVIDRFAAGSDHCDRVRCVGWVWCSRVREGACGTFLSWFGFRVDFGPCRTGWLCRPTDVTVGVGDVR